MYNMKIMLAPFMRRVAAILNIPKRYPHYYMSPETFIEVPVGQERSASVKEGDSSPYYKVESLYNCCLVVASCTKGAVRHEKVLHYNIPENSQGILETFSQSVGLYKSQGYHVAIDLVVNQLSHSSDMAYQNRVIATRTLNMITNTLAEKSLPYDMRYSTMPTVIISNRKITEFSRIIRSLVDISQADVKEGIGSDTVQVKQVTHIGKLSSQEKRPGL